MRGVEMPHHHHHMEVDKEGEGDRWGEDWEYRSEASMDADTSPGQIDEGVGPSQGEGQLSGEGGREYVQTHIHLATHYSYRPSHIIYVDPY